jgi:hypothetical protein
MATESLPDPLEVAARLGALLERRGIPYFVGGSIASSFLGEFRYTNDVDFVAELEPGHLEALFRELGDEFYVSREAALRAVQACGSFNLIHIPTVQKVGLFTPERTPFAREQIRRRRTVEIRPGLRLFIASPEDVVLSKLLWYRKGGSVSDRHWSDILGVLKVQGPSLDKGYLERWAGELGVRDLLDRALS